MGTTEEDRFDTTEASPWMRPFVSPRFLRSGHLQTIVGNLLGPRIPHSQAGERGSAAPSYLRAALILHALDDPFIRMAPDTRAKLVANLRVMLVETWRGGHCAFLSLEPGGAGFWAERTLLDFLLATVEG